MDKESLIAYLVLPENLDKKIMFCIEATKYMYTYSPYQLKHKLLNDTWDAWNLWADKWLSGEDRTLASVGDVSSRVSYCILLGSHLREEAYYTASNDYESVREQLTMLGLATAPFDYIASDFDYKDTLIRHYLYRINDEAFELIGNKIV